MSIIFKDLRKNFEDENNFENLKTEHYELGVEFKEFVTEYI